VGRTPDEAFRDFRNALDEALGCITAGRLSVPGVRRFDVGRVYSVVLNRSDPIRLRGAIPLHFSAGQRIRIVEARESTHSPFAVATVEYWYQFATARQEEILAFHWTPETERPGERRYPHLHVGSTMIAPDAPLFPKRFNKLHVPTERVPLAAIVRFAIDELDVEPIRAHWEEVLARTETALGQPEMR
jgi:hypothetical protein